MSTHYLHKFASLADLNQVSPFRSNALPFAAVGNVIYPGKSGASTPAHINFEFATQNLSKTVRLNSQTDSATVSGDMIGFQSKPRSGASGTQTVYGSQVSAQVSNGIAVANVVGGVHDVYLRGTSAGSISGRVSALDLELVTDDAGTRDITGSVAALRIRKAFSAGTVSGIQSAIRVEKPEAQTNSENYDGLLDLTGKGGDMWSDDPATELNLPGGTVKGYIKVIVNGAARYIALYEKGNLAD